MSGSLNPPGPTQVGAEARAERRIAFDVAVIAGPDVGVSMRVGSDPKLVGTSPVCDLKLADTHASRRHLSLALAGHRLIVKDLGSTNGTTVNGIAVVHALLMGGENVQIGRTVVQARPVLEEAAAAAAPRTHFGRVIGASPAMQRIYAAAERLAQPNVPIVIEGETGTGKEQLAEAIHEASGRADRPFIVFDCTAVAESLMESALFGHERGAFTGALQQRQGVFEQADGGTLFIDEIGDLDLSLQPKLLRAIQQGAVQRVGGAGWLKTDVRIIAATRRNLDEAVQSGRFRDDLFFRLAVGRIELPPLRERGDDVALLAQLFWAELARANQAMAHAPASLPADFLEKTRDHRWPGNVRELQNLVARRFALGDAVPLEQKGAVVRAGLEAMDIGVEKLVSAGLTFTQAREQIATQFEREYLRLVLARHDGNVSRAAEAAGIGRRYFHTILARAKP